MTPTRLACGNCGATAEGGAFCDACGSALTRGVAARREPGATCGICGRRLHPDDRFCDGCGGARPLAAPKEHLDRQGPRRGGRIAALVGAGVGVAALVAGAVAIVASERSSDSEASVAIPPLPPPAPDVARDTNAYLAAGNAGALLATRDQAAASALTLPDRPDSARCAATAGQLAAIGPPAALLSAIVEVPDEPLRTLLLAEQLAESRAVRACIDADASAMRDALAEASSLRAAAAARRAAIVAGAVRP